MSKETLTERTKKLCNRYVNGYCAAHACLERGGWKGGEFESISASCDAHEVVKILEEAEDIAGEFITRCDKGEVQSRHTYMRMEQLLRMLGKDPADYLVFMK